MHQVLCCALALLFLAGCASPRSLSPVDPAVQRSEMLRGSFGTYDGEPRLTNGHVDVQRLVSELTELRATTYNWLIWHRATDWEDLQTFLPLARKNKINVWITLVPPSESPPQYGTNYSEPFRIDYERWAKEIAQLSLREKNLVAWSLDDFSSGNQNYFTPEKLRGILEGARAINPKLAFVPCCYYPQINAAFAEKYRGLFDGVLFPYLSESATPSMTDFAQVEAEVNRVKAVMGTTPVFIDVYATGYSSLGQTTPQYVREVMTRGRRSADGVLIYCHQPPDKAPEKFAIIKELFHQWAANPAAGKTAAIESKPRNAFEDCFGTYGNAPRLANKHADIPKLLAELEDIHANTYHWLVRNSFEWDDLKKFLPEARKKNLKVWVTLVPPSEPPASEPFKLDYIRWAKEIAQLSVKEPNLVAWSIDDFPYNLKLFTPEYVATMSREAHAINAKLAFVPCCYFKQLKPAFIEKYKASFDGILFPYRADSAGGNLQDATLVESEVKTLRELLGQNFPIILDVYVTAHSRLGPSTADYVEQVMIRGKKCCEGVLIYCHQNPVRNADKYKVLKNLFGQWSGKALAGVPNYSQHFDRTSFLSGSFGTYGAVPRLPDGHADLPRLISELLDLHANTYHWTIHQSTNDWDDLKQFLPLAREQKIKVWVTIMPPSESPPHVTLYSEPFRLDYEQWAIEFAKLSLAEPNLVAWSIDDFSHNQKVFTPARLGKILGGSRQINPNFAFVPCCYFREMTPAFAHDYRWLLDGILFPYRDESGGANLKNPEHVESEIKKLREVFGVTRPILLDVYATAHSRLGATTPEYVEQVMVAGKRSADGVLVYKHQDPQTSAEKYKIMKRLFSDWDHSTSQIARKTRG